MGWNSALAEVFDAQQARGIDDPAGLLQHLAPHSLFQGLASLTAAARQDVDARGVAHHQHAVRS
jgi:hypothetical protein